MSYKNLFAKTLIPKKSDVKEAARKMILSKSVPAMKQIIDLTEKLNLAEKNDKKVQEAVDAILGFSKTVQHPPCGTLDNVTKLGKGTYGKVYMVIDDNGNFFAKKVVKSKDKDFDYAASMRELSALATFQGHPSIVRTFSTSVDFEKVEYNVVMELMDGNLKQFWENEKSITTRMAHFQSMAYQILSGLAFMHSEKIAHRDIKSQNIFYRKDGEHYQVKLGDFGLARRLSAKNYTDEVITCCYRPPEMLFYYLNQYGTEIDVWSTGMVFTEIILGYNLTGWHKEEDLILRLATIFDLSSYKSPLTKDIIPRGLSCYLKTHLKRSLDPLLLDLLEKMMNVDPFKRISAQDALNHPYFDSFNQLIDSTSAPRPNFLEPNNVDWTLHHTNLNVKMRSILIDWLREVVQYFKCSIETYSQCIEIIDAFMTKTTELIPVEDFQLIGIAAILISSAMNEIKYTSLDNLIWVSKRIYYREELIGMAWEIFNCLEHRMPRTRLSQEQINSSSESALKEICEKYCSSFPSDQITL